jgi:bifunctional non-homologous end joining protein LigD
VIAVSNADRVVFPEVGRTKGDVVAYYERLAPRFLPHVVGRPLSIRRYPKGLAAEGFFQKNVPAHYPASIERFAVPRSAAASKKHARGRARPPEVTVYPIVREAEHLAYLANQGMLELHVPTSRAADGFRPDRVVIDLDPPEGGVDAVRRAAHLTREKLAALGLTTVPVATGSKGYHVVAAITATVDGETVAVATAKVAALLAAGHPDLVTTAFRKADRGGRVLIDWMRNGPGATVVAPYSLRARPRAPVATPLCWEELDATTPDAFTRGDVELLPAQGRGHDPLTDLLAAPQDAGPFVAAADEAFARSGLVLEVFDRFGRERTSRSP